MSTRASTSLRRVVVVTAATSLLLVACGSSQPTDNSPDAPVENQGGQDPGSQNSVVPPVSVGAGGGAPGDNLDQDVNEPSGDGVGQGDSQTNPRD